MAKLLERLNETSSVTDFEFAQPNANCVLYMPGLPGNGSTIYDRSIYGNHGTIFGATWERLPSGLQANSFITDDYLSIPAENTEFDFTSEDFSIILAVCPTSLVALGMLFIRGRDNVDGYRCYLDTDGSITFDTIQVAAMQSSKTPAGSFAVNKWGVLGISRKGASVRLYVNGEDDTSTVGNHIDPITSNRELLFGINWDKSWAPVSAALVGYEIIRNQALTALEQKRHWGGMRCSLGV